MEQTIAAIDWVRLTHEFLAYKVPADFRVYSPDAFENALVRPLPRFARNLLDRRIERGEGFSDAARALYGFLLEKRYADRMNLLHFAFSIFDEESALPADIVARTPFPHEDGIPSYRFHADADGAIIMPDDLT